jgi:hypothetical protein
MQVATVTNFPSLSLSPPQLSQEARGRRFSNLDEFVYEYVAVIVYVCSSVIVIVSETTLVIDTVGDVVELRLVVKDEETSCVMEELREASDVVLGDVDHEAVVDEDQLAVCSMERERDGESSTVMDAD